MENQEKESKRLEEKQKIQKFFNSYGVRVECKDICYSTNSIIYVIEPMNGVRKRDIENLKTEIQMVFDAIDVLFIGSINKTPYLGIVLIKEKRNILKLDTLMNSTEFKETNKNISIILGKTYSGETIVEDLSEIYHMLVAGTVGTGKSVFLNTLILEIMKKKNPDEVKLLLIDTRGNNFSQFAGIPHLLIPPITSGEDAIGALKWIYQEMKNRYTLFSREKADNIFSYNERSEEKLPNIVIMIEDFGDLMDISKEVEEYTKEIVQMSRASGIYLVISTQRPSVDVITGTIKANILTKIAFNVPAQVDSRVILDRAGAEKLFELGDALFVKNGCGEPIRIETSYVSQDEIKNIVMEVRKNSEVQYREDVIEFIEKMSRKDDDILEEDEEEDLFLNDAIEAVIETGNASTSFIQRRFKVNYTRAGRIIDQMEERGIISGYLGSKPREVFMTKERWQELNADYDELHEGNPEPEEEKEEVERVYTTKNNIEEDDEGKRQINKVFMIIWICFIVSMIFMYFVLNG